MFIENVSLFSQFAIAKSFTKKKNYLLEIDTVIEATMKEELLHAQFGMYLIDLIKKEYPEWFNEDFYEKIYRACIKAYKAEVGILEWIFEKGELDFMSKAVVLEFIKQRFNNSLQSIGIKKIFDIDETFLKESDWFYDEIIATKHGDFFNKRSINYDKKSKSITSEDLF